MDNLNDINEWIRLNVNEEHENAGVPVTNETRNFQETFLRTAAFGATRKEVLELEEQGKSDRFYQKRILTNY